MTTGLELTTTPPLPGTTAVPQINQAFDALCDPGWTLIAAVNTNILTVQIKNSINAVISATGPVLVGFRDSNLTLGDPIFRKMTADLQLTVAATNTLGTVNGQPFRLWIVLIDNNGTMQLGVFNAILGGASPTAIVPLSEDVLQSPVNFGTGGDSAGTIVTITACSNKAIRILGYMEWASGLATAGQWASLPTKIQLFGPGIKKPGDIVQEVWGSATTSTNTTSSAFSASGLSASITPTSAANLISARADGNATVANTATQLQAELRRGTSTRVGLAAQWNASTNFNFGVLSLLGLDAPGTTSSTTYGPYIASSDNSHQASYPAVSYAGICGIIRLQELMG